VVEIDCSGFLATSVEIKGKEIMKDIADGIPKLMLTQLVVELFPYLKV